MKMTSFVVAVQHKKVKNIGKIRQSIIDNIKLNKSLYTNLYTKLYHGGYYGIYY